MKNYETEARERWGDTYAYHEHEQKTKNYTKEKWAEANDGLMAIFAEFAACKQNGAKADSVEAQALVAKLQAHITANYYTCTDEILAGLGQMYVADERFKKNIDKHVEGTAKFVSEAISCYLRRYSMSEAYDKGVFVMDYLQSIGFDFETILDVICDENLDKSYEIIVQNPTISKYEFVEKLGIEYDEEEILIYEFLCHLQMHPYQIAEAMDEDNYEKTLNIMHATVARVRRFGR